MGTIELGLDQLPWGHVLLAAILPDSVEGPDVGGCPGQEVRAVTEAFDRVEFVFHDAVDGFDIGLIAPLADWDGPMRLTRDCFDGADEGAWVASLPAADEL